MHLLQRECATTTKFKYSSWINANGDAAEIATSTFSSQFKRTLLVPKKNQMLF